MNLHGDNGRRQYTNEQEKNWAKAYVDRVIKKVSEIVDTLTGRFDGHKNAEVLDHPDGSVTKEKVTFDIIGKSGTAEGAEIFNDYVNNEASGRYSHAEGWGTKATYTGSHAEGVLTTASGNSSHAEGNETTASGQYSHAEGSGTIASGQCSHAEGYNATASGEGSHAEGGIASGLRSHSEGIATEAMGKAAHAEGSFCRARGNYSHAEGDWTFASGNSSHAEGSGTGTLKDNSHISGQNGTIPADSDILFAVANGDLGKDKLGLTFHENGDLKAEGDIYTGEKKVATEEMLSRELQSVMFAHASNINAHFPEVDENEINTLFEPGIYSLTHKQNDEPFWFGYLIITGLKNARFVRQIRIMFDSANTINHREWADVPGWDHWSDWQHAVLSDELKAEVEKLALADKTHKEAKVLDHPDGSVTDEKIGERWVNVGTTKDLKGNLKLSDILSGLGKMITKITGKVNWYDVPDITLADAKTGLEEIRYNVINIRDATGGFAGGNSAYTTDGGGAVGADANADTGGAVGLRSRTGYGAAIGHEARSLGGAAVGSDARAQQGFAGGNGAISDAENNIQLGFGTNTEEGTLQVYDYTLMNEDGTIPKERLPVMSERYICNGVNDNEILSQMCTEFYTNMNSFSYEQKCIEVIGVVGITDNPLDVGVSKDSSYAPGEDVFGNRLRSFFDFGRGERDGYSNDKIDSTRRIIFDFKNATIPKKYIHYSRSSPDVSMFYCDNMQTTISNVKVGVEVTFSEEWMWMYGFYGIGNLENFRIKCRTNAWMAWGIYGYGKFSNCKAITECITPTHVLPEETDDAPYYGMSIGGTVTNCTGIAIGKYTCIGVEGRSSNGVTSEEYTSASFTNCYGLGISEDNDGYGFCDFGNFLNCVGMGITYNSLSNGIGFGTQPYHVGNAFMTSCTGIGVSPGENLSAGFKIRSYNTAVLNNCIAPLMWQDFVEENPVKKTGIAIDTSPVPNVHIQGCVVDSRFGTKISSVSNAANKVYVGTNFIQDIEFYYNPNEWFSREFSGL